MKKVQSTFSINFFTKNHPLPGCTASTTEYPVINVFIFPSFYKHRCKTVDIKPHEWYISIRSLHSSVRTKASTSKMHQSKKQSGQWLGPNLYTVSLPSIVYLHSSTINHSVSEVLAITLGKVSTKGIHRRRWSPARGCQSLRNSPSRSPVQRRRDHLTLASSCAPWIGNNHRVLLWPLGIIFVRSSVLDFGDLFSGRVRFIPIRGAYNSTGSQSYDWNMYSVVSNYKLNSVFRFFIILKQELNYIWNIEYKIKLEAQQTKIFSFWSLLIIKFSLKIVSLDMGKYKVIINVVTFSLSS